MTGTLQDKEIRMRIHQAVRYIEEHLDDPLTAEELAKVASFSVHHFHRVFKRVMNENVLQFINRLKVEKAMKLMVFQPDRSLTDIALECGLQSPAHFARTFRRYTGFTASEYRARFGLDPTYMTYRESLMAEESGRSWLQAVDEQYRRLKIEVSDLPPQHVACVHHQGTLTMGRGIHPSIGVAYRRLEDWMRARHLLDEDSEAIGLIFDEPCITPESKQRYAVCYSTTQTVPHDLEVQPLELPGGKYAVLILNGRADIALELIHITHLHWLQLSPYQWDETRVTMTVFQGIPLNDPEGQVQMHFCIPVKLK